MKIAIIGVVPQPGATFPYSEFKGRRRVPTAVTIAGGVFAAEFFCVAIEFEFGLKLLLGSSAMSYMHLRYKM